MPFSIADFSDGLDARLRQINAQSPIVQNDPRMQPFLSYSANGTATAATYNPAAWTQNGGYDIREVCWADNTNTIGMPVAISPRHTICSIHGSEMPGAKLVWAGHTNHFANPTGTFVGTIVDTVYVVSFDFWVNQRPSPSSVEDNYGFAVNYIDPEIPAEYLCRVPSAQDFPRDTYGKLPVGHPTPYCGGPPCLIVNRQPPHQLRIANQQAGDYNNTAGDPHFVLNVRWPLGEFAQPGPYENELRAKFWPETQQHSGSPVFMCYNQLHLLYLGHLTEGSVQTHFRGPAFPAFERGILDAVRELNRRNGGTAYTPTYLRPGQERGPRVPFKPPARPDF